MLQGVCNFSGRKTYLPEHAQSLTRQAHADMISTVGARKVSKFYIDSSASKDCDYGIPSVKEHTQDPRPPLPQALSAISSLRGARHVAYPGGRFHSIGKVFAFQPKGY